MEERDLEQTGPKYVKIWRPCCSKGNKNPSELMKVREIHLIGLR